MNPTLWLLVGGALGWLVSLQARRSNSRVVLVDILAGAFGAFIGAVVGGLLVTPSFDLHAMDQASFSALSLAHSLLGSAMLLMVVKGLRPRHSDSSQRSIRAQK
jgi:uncharacterized membrane protein YeaQ/YmgE (transglycosylase-associated protein family)